ncbi:T-cell receptor alpha chain V region CTL-F3 [Takifugu flavidus]|nr:T-cell receptor alpha chain V region CTL-F3 [Takifugu flavidus]
MLSVFQSAEPKRHCAATKAEEMAAEDQTVTLDCHYTSTATSDYIFWYKQDGTSRPQFILSRFTIECRGEDKVMQPPEDVVAAEGDTVTLDCTFQTSDTNPYLFWYKQENNNFPKLLLRAKQKPSDPQRISALIIKTSAPLKIQELQLSDSAVYYCALRPTVTGSSRSAH